MSNKMQGLLEGLSNILIGGVSDALKSALAEIESFIQEERAQLTADIAALDQREYDLNERQSSLSEQEADLSQREADLSQREMALQQEKALWGKKVALVKQFEDSLRAVVDETDDTPTPVVVSTLQSLPVVSGDDLTDRTAQVMSLVQSTIDTPEKGCSMRNKELEELAGGKLPSGTISCCISRLKQDGIIEVHGTHDKRRIYLNQRLENPEQYLEQIAQE